MKRSLFQAYPKRVDIVFLLTASLAALVMGLRLPVFTVRNLWKTNTFTILGGVQNLWGDRQYFLAFVIFFFSIVFPIAKLAALDAIWFLPMRAESRKRILYMLSMMGKWSMLDVFVVAVIIVAVKLGVLASALAEKGIYYFATSIFLAMIATAAESSLAKKTP